MGFKWDSSSTLKGQGNTCALIQMELSSVDLVQAKWAQVQAVAGGGARYMPIDESCDSNEEDTLKPSMHAPAG